MEESKENWYEEKRSAYLYRILAQKEKGKNQVLFSELAKAAEEQALIWEKEIIKQGGESPKAFTPDLRSRLVAILIRYLGPQRIRTILAAIKVRGMSVYSTDNVGHPIPQTLSDVGRHHKNLDKSGSLRAAVFGVNDGLISNTGLILGMLGASSSHHVIILTGIAGLLAGSFSMAAGEYISMKSQREMFEYQIDLERKELEQYPNEEAEELALIYEARGIPLEDGRKMALTLMQDPVKALDILAKEELGLDPNHLGSPIGAALSSFFSFALGAIIPLLPFVLGVNNWHLWSVVILSDVSLFIIGMLISLFTGKNAFISGLRMFIIGTVTGLITYFVGHYFGAMLS